MQSGYSRACSYCLTVVSNRPGTELSRRSLRTISNGFHKIEAYNKQYEKSHFPYPPVQATPWRQLSKAGTTHLPPQPRQQPRAAMRQPCGRLSEQPERTSQATFMLLYWMLHGVGCPLVGVLPCVYPANGNPCGNLGERPPRPTSVSSPNKHRIQHYT
ncbi:MAG: hypothetical protein OJF50_004448 [Nitrospira sp.]|jgi:hypothetical protein|nr:hypothetical protein [Nitrospira sp.]